MVCAPSLHGVLARTRPVVWTAGVRLCEGRGKAGGAGRPRHAQRASQASSASQPAAVTTKAAVDKTMVAVASACKVR